MKKTLILLVFICICSIDIVGQKYIGDKNEIDKILKMAEQFSGYVVASNYDAIMNSYTEDAKIFPNNKDITEGHKDIRAYWILPEGMSTTYHKLEPVEIKVWGDEAYDYGYYEGKSLLANGEESEWRGKYVVIWKKVKGDWKMYLDIWNRIKQ